MLQLELSQEQKDAIQKYAECTRLYNKHQDESRYKTDPETRKKVSELYDAMKTAERDPNYVAGYARLVWNSEVNKGIRQVFGTDTPEDVVPLLQEAVDKQDVSDLKSLLTSAKHKLVEAGVFDLMADISVEVYNAHCRKLDPVPAAQMTVAWISNFHK